MTHTISFHIERSTVIFKGFNRFSKFLLIGNYTSGYVNVKIKEFQNFEQVIKLLPGIINDLAFYGKWELALYQVPRSYTMIEHPQSLRIPKNGIPIFKLDHQDATRFMDIFVNFSMIHLALYDKQVDQSKKGEKIQYHIKLTESYLTIQLEENIHQKKIRLSQYHGDQDKLFDSYRY